MKPYFILILLAMISCNKSHQHSSSMQTKEEEKVKILETLNNETKAAFSRDYESWKNYWLHEDFVTKTYINYQDSSFIETLGWNEINSFVKTYIEDHPTPDPIPEPLKDIEIRLYGNAAWIMYNQVDKNRGTKRETRLMEKQGDEWKIAGMHTTIYN